MTLEPLDFNGSLTVFCLFSHRWGTKSFCSLPPRTLLKRKGACLPAAAYLPHSLLLAHHTVALEALGSSTAHFHTGHVRWRRA